MPTIERRLQRERSNDIRHGVIAALKDNIGDEFTAAEIAAAIDGICTIESTRQLGGVLKSMRVDGLMTNRVKGNHSVWALQANALDGNVRPSLSMSKNNKPADNHPWKEKVCLPMGPRPQPISCELPAHLLTPQPTSEHIVEPANGTGDLLIANSPFSTQDEIKALEDHMRAEGSLPAESHEDEAPNGQPYSLLTQVMIAEAEMREDELLSSKGEAHNCSGHCHNHAKEQEIVENLLARIDQLENENLNLTKANTSLNDHVQNLYQINKTTQCAFPNLPEDYLAKIKVSIFADSDDAMIIFTANNEGSGAFWSLQTKGRLSFDPGEANWIAQLGDNLNGHHLTNQPEI